MNKYSKEYSDKVAKKSSIDPQLKDVIQKKDKQIAELREALINVPVTVSMISETILSSLCKKGFEVKEVVELSSNIADKLREELTKPKA